MYKGWVLVDVDGTLIDENDVPRPYIKELFDRLGELEVLIVVWSGGGKKYAQEKFMRACHQIGNPELVHYVHDYLWKADKLNWHLVRPVLFIDDSEHIRKEFHSEDCRVFAVPFYHSTTMEEHDIWLKTAADYAERFFNRYNKGGEKKPSNNLITYDSCL